MIQIPANFLGPDPGTSKARTMGDLDVIVGDLREVAEWGLREDPPVRFTYEALAWSTHVDTWGACWEVVQRVDRANFGICLDTFNLAGRVYADPAVRGGKMVNADAHLRASLARLVATVDARKFAFEEDRDGYLPILAVARAFFDLGFEGWVSLELFSRSTADPKPDTPVVHARREAES
ncbi:hypothetical protein ACJ73_06816 [Blastomyces percursus]|uniref:Xylose isomerase-like TIM barrel domain-containing protein n=1 Tax=Blastomyces percursus TaxID=1658174 RepID=A0A1J9Q155_9EURO|nr:hypothetical protein ACJ73_06816 [Blastomyces percursus]